MITVLVEVIQDREVVVMCVFQDTLSQRCYVQLVSGEGGGFYEAACVEGDNVEGSHVFTNLSANTYAVLVYGLTRDEETCSASKDPDYITVVSLPTPISTTPLNTPTTVTDQTGMHCSKLCLGTRFTFFHRLTDQEITGPSVQCR